MKSQLAMSIGGIGTRCAISGAREERGMIVKIQTNETGDAVRLDRNRVGKILPSSDVFINTTAIAQVIVSLDVTVCYIGGNVDYLSKTEAEPLLRMLEVGCYGD